MDIYRKIAILLIVILFSYILFRLLSQRVILMNASENYEGDKTTGEIENFTPQSSKVISIQKANTLLPNIANMNKNILYKPLNETYIKSAYGGGYDGDSISIEMMNYTLFLGYRYVVIHVFYDYVSDGTEPKVSESKTAVVGFSSLYSPLTNTANKTVSLYDFVQSIQENAFSPTSPNNGDPFFLHILPAYKKPVSETDTAAVQEVTGFNTQLNSQIEQALQDIKTSNRFVSNVKDTTPLERLKGKFITVMDSKPYYGNMTTNLKSLISMSVPTGTLQSVKTLKQPTQKWNVVLPLDETGKLLTNNSDYINKYRAYKINASPVCMWESRFILSLLGTTSEKTNLGDYEELFSKERSAFVI